MSIRFAVVSDLHLHDPGDARQESEQGEGYSIPARAGHFHTQMSDSNANENPFVGLRDLIGREHIQADYLVCAGDLSDQASPGGLKRAWRELHELAEVLGATGVVATAGNHDMDSRHNYHQFDPVGQLQALVPSFPTGDAILDMHYWAYRYCILEDSARDVRFVVLNTSAFHGFKDEFQHGRISDATLERVEADLSRMPAFGTNVLVMHHHLDNFSDIDRGDTSGIARNGRRLVNLLGSGRFGRWLIIHGHKHLPNVEYAPGSSASPCVLSVGSFGAKLSPTQTFEARNQFYIVELVAAELRSDLGLGCAGTIRAWDWLGGWQPARDKSGIPHRSGFGFRSDSLEVAREIRHVVTTHADPYVTFEGLVESLPRIQYLLPDDLLSVARQLQDDGLRVQPVGDNPLGQVAQ